MSVDKAVEFLTHVKNTPELQKKMSGFSQADLREAAERMKKRGELGSGVSADSTIIYECGFVVS